MSRLSMCPASATPPLLVWGRSVGAAASSTLVCNAGTTLTAVAIGIAAVGSLLLSSSPPTRSKQSISSPPPSPPRLLSLRRHPPAVATACSSRSGPQCQRPPQPPPSLVAVSPPPSPYHLRRRLHPRCRHVARAVRKRVVATTHVRLLPQSAKEARVPQAPCEPAASRPAKRRRRAWIENRTHAVLSSVGYTVVSTM